MAENKLTDEQRETLLTWIAADYDSRLIMRWMREQSFPKVSRQSISYYRTKYCKKVMIMREFRRAHAVKLGASVRVERIQRLAEHVDALEAVKWDTDKNGKLLNEKAWRETMEQIRKEMEFFSDEDPILDPPNVSANENVLSASISTPEKAKVVLASLLGIRVEQLPTTVAGVERIL